MQPFPPIDKTIRANQLGTTETGRVQYNSNSTKGKLVLVDITKAYSRSRGTAPLILNLATRWRCVLNVATLQLSFRVRGPVPSKQKPG